VKEVVEKIRERAAFVSEFWELSSFYFESPKEFDSKSAKKAWKKDSQEWMRVLIGKLESIEDFSQSNVQSEIKEWINTQGLSFGKIMQPLRLALVGAMSGPDVFHIVASIGKVDTISRLDYAIEKLA
jgi:glutamyl-tRNA synthetase